MKTGGGGVKTDHEGGSKKDDGIQTGGYPEDEEMTVTFPGFLFRISCSSPLGTKILIA